MSDKNKDPRTRSQLLEEIERLRLRLEEAEETLEAIRSADVDAVVVAGPQGEQVFSLTGVEHIYRVIVETMNEAALMVDPDGTILFCNQRFCDLMKTPIQEAMGRKVAAFVAGPQREPLRTILADAQSAPVQRRLTLRAADGAAVPVQLAASLLQAGGRPSICLVATDLTELEESARSIRVLREHQQALQESEARFRTIFEASQDAIVITDDAGFVVQANPATHAIFGLPPEKIMGRPISSFAGETVDFPALWQAFRTNGSFRGEVPMTDAEGRLRHVEAYAVANILPGRHLSVLRDITERKLAREALEEANARLSIQTEELTAQTEELRVQTEESAATNAALRQSELRYRELVQNANSAIIRWTRDGTVTFFNEYAQSFFHYREEEAVGRNVSFLVPPQDSSGADLSRLAREIVEHPQRYANHVNENVCRDGRRVWMAWTNKPILDEDGRVAEILAVGTDVTERKRAEEALQRSEEQFHRLFEDDLTGNFVSTPAGQILLCNPAFAQIFGFGSAQDAVGTHLLDLYFEPQECEPLVERLRRERKIERLEAWRKRRDGEPIYIVENLVGHFNERGELYEIKGYIFDDTERKRAEEALRELNTTLEARVAARTAELQHRTRQLQKLALELSETEERERRQLAEILHDDLQQQLAAAKFHLSLLHSRARHDPAQQGIITQVDQMLMEAIQKSRSLSHELSPVMLHHSNLVSALEWLAGQVRSKHGLDVTVEAFSEVTVESEALKIFLYKAAQEMLFNVVKHARTDRARIRVRRFGHCICLSVSDRGRGFDPQEVRQTPGFGLLSIGERIELLGGRMKMHSVKGKGSTFHVVVPDGPLLEDGYPGMAGAAPRGQLLSSAAGPDSRGLDGQGGPPLRVLLADDHQIVREGLLSLLSETTDIQVVGEAANGRDAINQAYQLQPDVVIMDVAMPLINGDDATRQIKLHLPRTRVIALSMYEDAEEVEKMRQAGAEGYILKTAPSEQLLAAIRGHPPS
jgi:PAS domain S-box-containing protein